jgi:hypothetical protein
LGDLGVGGEDLLGMGEDFDLMEFADALDNLEDLSGDEEQQTGGKKNDGKMEAPTPAAAASPAGAAAGAAAEARFEFAFYKHLKRFASYYGLLRCSHHKWPEG